MPNDAVAAKRERVDTVRDDASASIDPLRQTEAKNILTIVELERSTRARGTVAERLIDRLVGAAASPIVIAVHLAGFTAWILLNRGEGALDPYPFSLLTLVVSLEAILLSLFLLISQNRMNALADRRANLDLQINLLAEQELTAILRILCRLADQAGVDLSDEPKIAQFRAPTDIAGLADILDDAMKDPDDPGSEKTEVASS